MARFIGYIRTRALGLHFGHAIEAKKGLLRVLGGLRIRIVAIGHLAELL